MNKKGFTLIELMVVIVIIGILAALAIPRFMAASAKAKVSEIPNVMGGYEHAQLAYITETGACGFSSNLSFDQPTNSKWFGYYDGGSAGTFVGSNKTAISTVVAGNTANVNVTTAGVVTRAAGLFSIWLPNFN